MHWHHQHSPQRILVKYSDLSQELLELRDVQYRLVMCEPSPSKGIHKSSSARPTSDALSSSRAGMPLSRGQVANGATLIDLTLESAPSPPAPPVTLVSLHPGCHVKVWWANESKWVKGRVIKHTDNGKVLVEYAKGWLIKEPLRDAQQRPTIRLDVDESKHVAQQVARHCANSRRKKPMGAHPTRGEAARACDDAEISSLQALQSQESVTRKRKIGQCAAVAPKRRRKGRIKQNRGYHRS